MLAESRWLGALDANKKSQVLVWATLAAFAGLMTYMNLMFLTSIDSVADREIDELAFHLALSEARTELLRGQIGSLLTSGDYAYGWIFWASHVLFTLPFEVIGAGLAPDSAAYQTMVLLQIFVPRQVALLLTVVTVVIWLKVLSQMTPSGRPTTRVFQVLLLVSLPMVSYSATKFHPTALVGLLTALSLFVASKNWSPDKERGRFILSGLFIGAAIGVKLSAIFVLPMLALFLWVRRRDGRIWRDFWDFFSTSLIAAYLTSAPLAPYQLLRGESVQLFDAIAGQLYNQAQGFADLWTVGPLAGIEGFYFSLLGLVTITVMAVMLAWSRRSFQDDLKYRTFVAGFGGLLVGTAAAVVQVQNGSLYLASYLLPIAFMLAAPLALFELGKMQNIVSSGLIAVLFASNFQAAWITDSAVNDPRDRSVRAINFFSAYAGSPAFSEGEQTKKKLIDLGVRTNETKPTVVVADYRVALPVSPMRPGVTVYYVFDNIEIYKDLIAQQNFDFVIVGEKSDIYRLLRGDLCTLEDYTTDVLHPQCSVAELLMELDPYCDEAICVVSRELSQDSLRSVYQRND